MSPRLKDRVAIVTGASSGIGRAIALAYAREGATVVTADLHEKAPSSSDKDATHEQILKLGGKAKFLRTDVTDESQIEDLVANTVKDFGRLDIMVNNAGIAFEIAQMVTNPGGIRLHETDTALFDRTMQINVRGVYLGCKYAVKQFLNQEPLPPNSRGDATRGWIVNLGSVAGLVGFHATTSYTTSKHAVIGLTKEIAISYAKDRIHCNAICPGFVDSPLLDPLKKDKENTAALDTVAGIAAAHPWGAIGNVEDVARAAVFLTSEDSQWVTGSSLVVDGGYIAQ